MPPGPVLDRHAKGNGPRSAAVDSTGRYDDAPHLVKNRIAGVS